MATWRKLIVEQMKCHGETLADVVANTLSDSEMDVEFDDGWGEVEGKPFTLWTANRVYFPWRYDGSEGVESVSRVPDGVPTNHVGGG